VAALEAAARALRDGRIIAAQGVGGFHLFADATAEATVARLRARKRRPDQPLAVLFGDVTALRLHAHVSAAEAELLLSPAAPIVLVAPRETSTLAPSVRRGAQALGALVPPSPLHALLAEECGLPLVYTSGNVAGGPICTSTPEALDRLGDIADAFLVHDRPIARPVEDSVARVDSRGVTTLLRRARGFAPAPVARLRSRPGGSDLVDGLALGAHLDSTLTLVHHGRLIPSPHLGDLDGLPAQTSFRRTARDWVRLHDARPRWIACDLHPDYPSTRLAEVLAKEWDLPLLRIQHHHAHVAACIAEHAAPDGEVSAVAAALETDQILGLCWDGTGMGPDGTLWGGEALIGRGRSLSRWGRLRPFLLPGGERAAEEPRRCALGLLCTVRPARLDAALAAWPAADRAALVRALARGDERTYCSSMDRLCDAIAALLGLATRVTFPGQAADILERLAAELPDDGAYPLPLLSEEQGEADDLLTLDPGPLVDAIIDDHTHGTPPGPIARRFHNALATAAVALATRARCRHVILSGACFRGPMLTDRVAGALEASAFRVWLPRRLPTHDAAVSIGQAWLAAGAFNAS